MFATSSKERGGASWWDFFEEDVSLGLIEQAQRIPLFAIFIVALSSIKSFKATG